MSSSPTPDPNEIRRRGRQRLIGAVAIAVLLIVFVPMVLDSEPRSAKQEPAVTIPPRDNVPALPPPTPPPTKAPAAQGPTAEVTVPTAAPETKAAEAKAPKLEGFAIQIGAFHDEAKLAQAREKLASAKVAHYTERVETSKGTLVRLRAGPFPTREAADRAAASLKKAGLDGKVVSLP